MCTSICFPSETWTIVPLPQLRCQGQIKEIENELFFELMTLLDLFRKKHEQKAT